MTPNDRLERQLRAALLLAPVANDRLVLADAVLGAAIDGSVALSAAEKAALAASPLTIRRFRQLVAERSAWRASAGMLRAADSGAALTELVTDDGCWRLHFTGAPGAWHVILQLAASAPFAQQLLAGQPLLRVVDGAGALVLSGRLDRDGECESAWPFASAPAQHFQRCGAAFAVEAVKALP